MSQQWPGTAQPSQSFRAKIEGMLDDVRGDDPKRAFINDIWPALRDDYEAMRGVLEQYCKDEIKRWQSTGIRCQVSSRTKTADSIKKSLDRREQSIQKNNGQQKFNTIQDILREIHDLIGLRIILEFPDDMDRAVGFINTTFQKERDPTMFPRKRKVGEFWDTWFGAYQTLNYRVSLKSNSFNGSFEHISQFCGVLFEIQLTTLSEDLYNKLAHPLLYKNSSGTLSQHDEMVVDMSHGLSICYALCVRYMKDRLANSQGVSGSQRGLKAIRDESSSGTAEQDSQVVADVTRFAQSLTGQISGQATAEVPPQECHSISDLKEWLSKKLDEMNCPPALRSRVEWEDKLSQVDVPYLANLHSTDPRHDRVFEFHHWRNSDDCGPSIQSLGNISTGSGQTNTGHHQIIAAQHPPASISKPSDACLRSLAFSKMDDRSHDIDHAVAGTCEWLFRHETYRSWAACDRGLLCIKGKPGCGKSTLLKYALNKQEATGDLVLSFFFHGRGNELQRTPLGLLRSLLHQVLRQSPEMLSVLVDTFEKKCKEIGDPGGKWHWHEEELWRFFESSLRDILITRSVWLFLDALDECGKENAIRLIRRFESLLTSLPRELRQFHVCFACRPYPILAPDGSFEIHPQDENKADISTLVDDRLSIFPTLASSTVPALITDRASGIFLWARLVTERVLDLEREGASVKKIESAIYSVPPELDTLYQELIENMTPVSLKLVQLICFAMRPLSVDELRWAMIIDDDCSYHSLHAYRSAEEYISDSIRMKRLVHTLSCGLVEVTPSDPQVVQFIHQSVKDFFAIKGLLYLDSGSMSVDEATGRAHFKLSRICIRYLAMEEICTIPDEPTNYEHRRKSEYERRKFRKKQVKEFSTAFPFLAYAANYWTTHVRRSSQPAELLNSSLRLCDVRTKSFQSWFEVYWMERLDDTPNWSTLIVASNFGLDLVVMRLLELGADIKAEDRHHRTALLRAAENGYDVIVQLLLDHGADHADEDHYQGGKPLYLAAKGGHRAIVQLLMEHGADIDDYGGWNHESAVHIAAEKGHIDVVRDLLDWSYDVEIESTTQRPLHSAVQGKAGDVTRLLVEKYEADINAFTYSGRTPFHFAIQDGNEDLVRYFIERGVDMDAQAPFELLDYDDDEEDFGGTALHCAASSENPAIMQVLLHHSPDLDARDIYGRTALHRAAKDGREAIVRLLLTAGADAHPKDDEEWTPLFYATLYGHNIVMELLLATGYMGQDSEDMHKGVILLSAARKGDEYVVRRLLDETINIEVKTGGMTPLSFAAHNGHLAIAQLLLEKGADVEAKSTRGLGGSGLTPLLLAAKNGYEAIVQLLLENGADIEAKSTDDLGGSGLTPLLLAAEKGYEAIVQQLLDRDADVEAKVVSGYNSGRTPLIVAAGGGHKAVIQQLLRNGANIEARCTSSFHAGQTALSIAAANGRETAVQCLLDKGADVNWEDDNGRTPLDLAAESQRWSVIELLLDKYASTNIENTEGSTLLISAASKGQADVVKLALEKGADIRTRDWNGLTLLNAAASNGHVGVVRLLLGSSADAAVPNNDGWTPLNTAASNGHVDIVRLLLESGADAAVPNNDGWTPLNTAASNGHVDIVRLLLESGANVAVPNNDGWTPLNTAASNGHINVFSLLLERYADVAEGGSNDW